LYKEGFEQGEGVVKELKDLALEGNTEGIHHEKRDDHEIFSSLTCSRPSEIIEKKKGERLWTIGRTIWAFF
jgi:hypothetical protein